MIGFLFGAAVGYVLGARAGRQRYEQIVRGYQRIVDHPAVQGAAGVAKAKVGELVGQRRDTRDEPPAAPVPRPRHDAIPRA